MDVDVSGILPLLEAVVAAEASDLHIRGGELAKMRVRGELVAVSDRVYSPEDCARIIRSSMRPDVRAEFEETFEADYAIAVEGVGRFRANAFRASGSDGAVLRRIGDEPVPLDTLGVPSAIGKLALKPRGLVLVTGPTGSGKTTTLAAMIDAVNAAKPVHILTLEDPIEVVHKAKRATVTQRELGADTRSWGAALKGAMRQDPDVILIGEMRDADTVKAGLSAAETGHVVFSTLHTTDALETIHRIMEFFPPHEQPRVRAALATSLQGIVCQRLIPKNGGGRVCAMEIAVNDARLAEAIAVPEKTDEIPEILEAGEYSGSQSFDQHLTQLVLANTIDARTALQASSNPHDFTVKLKRTGWKPPQ